MMKRCQDFVRVDANFLKIFCILLSWQLCFRSITGYVLDYGKMGELQLSAIWPELKLPNAVNGELYQANIASSSVRDYNISFLVSKVGSQELPKWLVYDNTNFSLVGIPLNSDVGLHQLLVLAMRYNETTSNSDLLGTQTFEINVVSKETLSYCAKGVNFVVNEVSLAVNGTHLNSTQRIELYQWFLREFNLSDQTRSLYFEYKSAPENISLNGCEVLDNYNRNTTYIGAVLSISWLVGCDLNVSMSNESEAISEKLREDVLDYSVFSWRTLSGSDSIICFPNIHKSTVVSSTHPRANVSVLAKATSQSVQMDPTRTTDIPLSMFGINSSEVYNTSADVLSSPVIDQSSVYSTMFDQSYSALLTAPTRTILPSTAHQLYSSPIKQSSLAKLTSFMTSFHSTQEANSSLIAFRESFTSITSTLLNPSFRHTLVLNKTETPNSTSQLKEISGLTTRNVSFYMELQTSTVRGQYTNTLSSWKLTSTRMSIVPTSSQSISPTRNLAPVVRHPLPNINITSCQYLYYKVPEDTFWDREDGNTEHLTLRLLTKNLRELPNDSWVNFDATVNLIYGVPVFTQIFTNSTRVDFEYTLSAVDSTGRTVNTNVSLTVYDDSAPTGQQISLEVETSVESTPFLQLIQKLSEYLYSGDDATMKIVSLASLRKQGSLKIYLTWSDCKAILDVCDVRRVERTSKLIRVNKNYVNPHFVIALVPEFLLLNTHDEKFGMCLNEAPLATRTDLVINITCCRKFHYEVPRDLFYDKEQGDSRNLSLSIRYSSSSRLPSEKWVILNDTSKTIEGVVIFDKAKKYPDGTFDQFFIVAMDYGRREANVSVMVVVEHPLPVSNYFVSLFLKRFHSFSTPLQEAFIIIEKLVTYFVAQSSDTIRVLSYSRETSVTVFAWSLADLRFRPCDPNAIANISVRLKNSDGQVNDAFKLILKPEFEVQFIFEERLGHCKEGANEQPFVFIPLHRIRLNLTSTFFEYEIPVATFNDLEDGNTRNLRISLLLPSFESLPTGFWVVLNREKQVIYGLPDEHAIQGQPIGGYRYLLVGQDSGGKVASSSVIVELPETTPPYNYQITAHLLSYLGASLPNVDHVVEFLRRLSTFLGEDKDSTRIVSYNISKTYPAGVTISWTNRTASFNTCDHEIIRNRFELFSNEESGVTKPFSEILLPYFIVRDIKLEFRETCKVFPNTLPVLLSSVQTLKVPLYQVLKFQIPEKMFFDKEDGYTRNLTVNVLNMKFKEFNSSSWIQFNATTQLLYGLPTSTVAMRQPTDGYVIAIVAMDTGFGTVNSTTRLVIDDTKATVNYVVKISATINASRGYSDIDLVLIFLSKLQAFVGNYDIVVTNYLIENSTLKVWISTLSFHGIECNSVEIKNISQRLFHDASLEDANKIVRGRSKSIEPSRTSLSSHALNISTDAFVNIQQTLVSPNSTPSFQPIVNSTSVLMHGKALVNTTVPMADNRINENFTRAMLPDFWISSVIEYKRGPCSNTPPTVLQPVPHVVISTHGLFSVALPSKTFFDEEDGFTTNLSVALLGSSGHALPPNSWLQINASTYELYGVVTEEVSHANYTFLLIAEDSYGLKVNTSLSVEVISRPLNLGLKLNIIFKSNFTSIVPHVDIMKVLLDKIKRHYNDSITVSVLSFERGSGVPSTDILSWTVPDLDSKNCDLEQLHEISQKARFSNNQPTEEFRRVLSPEFELLVVFEQRLGSCANRVNSPPTAVLPILNLNITRIPTVFHYGVPRNTFRDAEDGDTKNVTLMLLGGDNEQIPRNSSIQFNAPSQVLYGILTKSDLDSKSRVKRYILRAIDSGGKAASIILELILRNVIISYNYELHMTFVSYLSSTSPDVTHLINFQEKLREFQVLRDMQVADYLRFPGYPAKFEVRFINSSSNFLNSDQDFCDFAEISRITETFQDSTSSLKSEFTASFLPEFVVQESYVQRLGPCEILPSSPPRVNRVTPIINISICETLEFQIPEDTFLDEDGNTRTLSLNLEIISSAKRDLDWMFLDNLSQIIYAIPTLDVVENQPIKGYILNLTATDSHGDSAELNITVLIRDTFLKDSYRPTVFVRVPSLITAKEDTLRKTIKFIEATKSYLRGSSTNNIRVIEFSKISETLLNVTWSNCSLRYTPCDYRNIEAIRRAMIFTGTVPQPRYIQSLAPEFIVDSVKDEMRGPCLNKHPVVLRTLKPLNATLCEGLLQYSVPNNTFLDEEDGYTSNLTLSMLYSTLIPLSENYWLTIDQSQTIIGYPSVDALRTQPEAGYEFLLNARDSHGLSTNLAINVLYDGEIPQSSYEVTLVLQTQFQNLTNSVDQMRFILPTLARYMGGSETSIRVHSYLRARANSTTSFLTWSNCSFIINSCDLLGIVETSKRLKTVNGKISEQLKDVFRPYFELKFVFEQRLGACLDDTNIRPQSKRAVYQLILDSFCGFLQFKIPEDFFLDKEDGGTRNLTLSLKAIDSKEISTDSWIQLDQESQTLYGFPTLSNSSNSSISTKESFILIAADPQGKLGMMRLEFIFNKKVPDIPYGITVEMSSYVGESLADIYHVKRFVERLALFLKADMGSIMVTKYYRKTTGTSSTFSVMWTNCSVAMDTCDANQINILYEKLNLIRNEVDQGFSQSMLPYFIPSSITLEKFGLCKIASMKYPPQLFWPIGTIFAYSGSLLRYSVPEDIFVDKEDGNALNLSLVLQFNNKVAVPSSYWLKFDNTSLVISGVTIVENSWKRSFRLVARDQHGNEAVDRFEIFIESKCPENFLSYQVITGVIYTKSEGNFNEVFLRKLEVYFQAWFSDTNFTLLSMSREAGINNTFLINWSHARTCGVCFKVNATLQALSENITDSNGTALEDFKEALKPEFILVNISEIKCSRVPGVPISIVKGGEDDRYLLYIAPIVVLLIFLLFSFIFFICRTFVFPYESKKEEVILDKSPISSLPREIHVTERIRSSEASMYNEGMTSVINESFLGNNDAINLPEIFLDKRVSPSKSSLPQNLSSVSSQEVEPTEVPTPPLYSDAVLLLAAESARKPEVSRTPSPTSHIEMREIPIDKREIASSNEAIPVSGKSEVDGRYSPRRSEERLYASRSPSLHSKPFLDNQELPFPREEDPVSTRNRLRLPSPPKVDLLRLPPVPKPLNSSPSSPLGNTPNSPSSSAYSTPLLTPNYSQTTVNNTYNLKRMSTPPEVPIPSPNNYSNPPAYAEYPYGTPMRERTQLGLQSPLGFPIPQDRVPYVNHEALQQRPPLESRQPSNNLHDALGQLRETVNRELDRRDDVDKYMDYYLNR